MKNLVFLFTIIVSFQAFSKINFDSNEIKSCLGEFSGNNNESQICFEKYKNTISSHDCNLLANNSTGIQWQNYMRLMCVLKKNSKMSFQECEETANNITNNLIYNQAIEGCFYGFKKYISPKDCNSLADKALSTRYQNYLRSKCISERNHLMNVQQCIQTATQMKGSLVINESLRNCFHAFQAQINSEECESLIEKTIGGQGKASMSRNCESIDSL